MKILRPGVPLAVLAVLLISTQASASEPEPHRLDQLRAIADRAVPYHLAGGAVDQIATLDPFQCTLNPSVVHPRTSSRGESVGAKPYTECEAGTPTIISQSSTLYIVEWAGAVYKPMATATATSRGVPKLTQKNVEWFCINRNLSTFQQETKGYTVQDGRTFESAVTSRKDDIDCGY